MCKDVMRQLSAFLQLFGTSFRCLSPSLAHSFKSVVESGPCGPHRPVCRAQVIHVTQQEDFNTHTVLCCHSQSHVSCVVHQRHVGCLADIMVYNHGSLR